MSRHIKRLAAPRTWKIKRKESKFVVKPRPGPHSIEESLPLLIIVRDLLGYAKNAREAKKVIKEGKILVDGRVRRDHKFPVGLMDIIEIPSANDYRIVIFDKRGKLVLEKIGKKNAKYKLCKIKDKSFVKGGDLQLHLHDGRNLLIRVKDPCSPREDVYKTKDTIVLNLENNKIKAHFKYDVGSLAYITGGSHVGEVAKIKEIKITRSSMPNVVTLENEEEFETIEDYIFVIGEKEPYLPVFKW